MYGILNDMEVEALLAEEMVGRIGCHHDGMTYVVPVSYAYDGKYIYGLSFKGLKLNIMRQNPKICFEVDVLTDIANWKSVIAWGTFEEVVDEEEKERIVSYLVRRTLPFISSAITQMSPIWPFVDKDLSKIKGVVFRILLENKTGRFTSSRPVVSNMVSGRL